MVYKWYILPIGGLYATYHRLGEPETTIDLGLPNSHRSSCERYDCRMLDDAGMNLTLPETNSHFAPENGWLEDEFLVGGGFNPFEKY